MDTLLLGVSSVKKLKLIYNPSAGDATFKNRLDSIIERMQKSDYMVVPFRSSSVETLHKAFEDLDSRYELVCVSGGDGTISTVVNIMASKGIELPLGIFPFGTANDLATYLGIPKDVDACCKIIERGKVKKIDIGRANDKYFINFPCIR
jgi:diacylglycerol kinase family enzyme